MTFLRAKSAERNLLITLVRCSCLFAIPFMANSCHRSSKSPSPAGIEVREIPEPQPTPADLPVAGDSPRAGPAAPPALGMDVTSSGLRPLSKRDISNSLKDILKLAERPRLPNFHEQSSRVQIYRNSFDILNNAESLTALERDINQVIDQVKVQEFGQQLVACNPLALLSCRETFLLRFATSVWRRPLNEAEKSLLLRLASSAAYEDWGLQEVLIRRVMTGIFYDTRFLFRHEFGAGDNSSLLALEPWEKLSALTYTLSQRPPSLELIDQLNLFQQEPERWAQLIEQLTKAKSFGEVMADFVAQWLMMYELEDLLLPSVPDWNQEKARAYAEDLQRDFLATLAQSESFYALVVRPGADAQARGFLTSRAFLTASGKDGKASMIRRGVRIVRNALCQNLPPPPNTIDTSPPKDLDPADPQYDEKLLLQHSSKKMCQGCHNRIDPAGLSLQAFDGLGNGRAYQVDFTALGLDPSLTVSLKGESETLNTLNAQLFTESMARSKIFARCFARNALRFVMGRDLALTEVDVADALAESYLGPAAKTQDSVVSFFQQMVKREEFYQRKAPAGLTQE